MSSIAPDLAKSRRELRKQDRRQAILDAAVISFMEKGYAGTSMSGLLETLGGSKATLWGYFRSKEELFAAVIDSITASLRAELEGLLSTSDDLEQALIAFCSRFIRAVTSPEAMGTWRLVISEGVRFPEIGRIFYERGPQHVHILLSAFLSHHISVGNLCAEDPKRMAEMIISLCIFQQTHIIWGIAPPRRGAIDEDAIRFTRLFLRAYAARG